MAFSPADMNLFAFSVNVADSQRQGFAQPEAHRIGGQKENPVAQFSCFSDKLFNFWWSKDVREGFDLGGFYDIDPLPLFFKHEFPKEFEPPAIDFHRAPGMSVHQLGEIGFQLLGSEFIRAATEMVPQSPDGSCVCIPGFFTLALKLEHSQVALIQFIEPFGFFRVHGILSITVRNWTIMESIQDLNIFFRRVSGFVQQSLPADARTSRG